MASFDQFLSATRFRQSITKDHDSRNPFENDFTRVIFSSAFRRLQDKTQVFQLEKGDFVRTRLTHSMEVSSLGRSIGLSLEDALINRGDMSEAKRGYVPSILAAAGLVHDLGNPPFGHFGEGAIQRFFAEFFEANPTIANELTEAERADLLHFDGNVQTFRVLRKLHFIKDRDGMNLTFAVLATVIKYPFSSLEGNKKGQGLSRKKFGFFQSEAPDYGDIQKAFDLKGRFPLTFLLEAADDIAYSVADIEDAVKKGIIGYDDIKGFLASSLTPMAMSEEEQEADFLGLFIDLYEEVASDYKNRLELAVGQFRIIVQGFMIRAIVQEFLGNYDTILAGTYDQDLLESSYASSLRRTFDSIGSRIFSHKSILENEIVGYNVISNHLKEFVPAVLSEGDPANLKESRYYQLISSNYRYIYEKFTPRSTYNRLQLAVDYIGGMTDGFALDRYRKYSGIK